MLRLLRQKTCDTLNFLPESSLSSCISKPSNIVIVTVEWTRGSKYLQLQSVYLRQNGYVTKAKLIGPYLVEIFTARQRSCGKVMFSQVSVILSSGRGVGRNSLITYPPTYPVFPTYPLPTYPHLPTPQPLLPMVQSGRCASYRNAFLVPHEKN